jgi:integrase
MRIEGPYRHYGGYRCRIARDSGRVWCPVAPTARQAQRLAELCLEEIEREALTVSEACTLYRPHLQEVKGNKPTSCDATISRLLSFFSEHQILVRDLTPQRCTRYYNDLVQKPSATTGKPLAVDTHRNCLAEAKTFLAWCVENKWLPTNPLANVRGVGRRRHGKKQLTIDEARRWLRVAMDLAPSEDGAVAAILLLLCGLRSSEVVDRIVRDVDDRGRVLRVPFGKTLAAARVVALPAELKPHMVALCKGKTPESRLFGQHWRDWPRKWVKKICGLAKVPSVCAHSMRGLHATLALQAGQTPHVVAATLGHESTSTTLQSYAAAGSAEAGSFIRALQTLQDAAPDLSRPCPAPSSPLAE